MKEGSRPRRGPMATHEKAKDFKGSIKRLFKELNPFKFLITISMLLAIMGAILSILAPNRLSKLTDTISEGLVINTKNMEQITTKITNSLQDRKTLIPEILALDLTPENITNLLTNSNLNEQEKKELQDFTMSISTSKPEDILTSLTNLSPNILNYLVQDTTYKGQIIKKEDKINFIEGLKNLQESKIPESIGSVLFKDITIDNVKISALDQTKFINLFQDSKNDTQSLYKHLDQAPKSIQTLIKPKMNMSKIKKITLFLIFMYLCSAIFTYVQHLIMTSVSNKFARHLRSSISKKINILPLKYFDLHKVGDTLSRVTNDVDQIAMSMNQALAPLVSSLTLFLGTIVMMFYTNWIMALTAIFSSIIGFAFMSLVLGKSQKYFIARQEQLGNLNGHIEEIYSNLNVVRAYNGVSDAQAKFDVYNNRVYEANFKSQFLSGLMMPMMAFIGNFGYVAVCIVGALLTMNGHISFGVIVAFITYVRLFTSPLSQIAQAMTSLQSTAAAGERVFEFLDEEEMASQENITKSLAKSKVKGNIEFKNVVFKYAGNEKPTIKNFSAKALAGQKIAIVGPTGAGKTTMVNLLMKFYDIDSGDILIDGISTKNLTRENIHDLFTMVLQDTWVFDGTIKENIVYNRKNISDEEIKSVCKTVGLDHFIKTLPNGYNSTMTDNDTISSGQKQLLTIARGMLEDTPFLILDEATSNVDTRTEELVQKAMDKLTQGRTSFIIAHRLSTIKNADLILVMKDGNIIESGNHKQLMKQKGFYHDLYNSQFEL